MIKIKSATQIEQMKKAGALSKMALRHVGAMVRPGVSTFELDQLAEQIIRMHGGTPAFKGYGGFLGRFSLAPQRPRPRPCARLRAIALRLPSSRLSPVTISGMLVMPFSLSPSLTAMAFFVTMLAMALAA